MAHPPKTEQESLIATLAHQNAARNTSFLRLLSALPLLSCIPFLLGLFLHPTTQPRATTPPPDATGSRSGPATVTATTTSHHTVLCLLGLSSLAATGFMLYRLGVTETGFALLDSASPSSSSSTSASSKHGQTASPASGSGSGSGSGSAGYGYGYGYGYGEGSRIARVGMPKTRRGGDGILGAAADGSGKSPLERHLPWLNVGLAVLALLTGLLERINTAGPGSSAGGAGVNPLLLGVLPGVVYAVVVGAKVVMAGVDPERELSGLKYGYKGA